MNEWQTGLTGKDQCNIFTAVVPVEFLKAIPNVVWSKNECLKRRLLEKIDS